MLSAGQDIQKDAEGKPQSVQVVNLLVTPEQAQILALASNQMKIQLVLRNPLDTSTVPVPETAMTNLFGGPKRRNQRQYQCGPRKAEGSCPATVHHYCSERLQANLKRNLLHPGGNSESHNRR